MTPTPTGALDTHDPVDPRCIPPYERAYSPVASNRGPPIGSPSTQDGQSIQPDRRQSLLSTESQKHHVVDVVMVPNDVYNLVEIEKKPGLFSSCVGGSRRKRRLRKAQSEPAYQQPDRDSPRFFGPDGDSPASVPGRPDRSRLGTSPSLRESLIQKQYEDHVLEDPYNYRSPSMPPRESTPIESSRPVQREMAPRFPPIGAPQPPYPSSQFSPGMQRPMMPPPGRQPLQPLHIMPPMGHMGPRSPQPYSPASPEARYEVPKWTPAPMSPPPDYPQSQAYWQRPMYRHPQPFPPPRRQRGPALSPIPPMGMWPILPPPNEPPPAWMTPENRKKRASVIDLFSPSDESGEESREVILAGKDPVRPTRRTKGPVEGDKSQSRVTFRSKSEVPASRVKESEEFSIVEVPFSHMMVTDDGYAKLMVPRASRTGSVQVPEMAEFDARAGLITLLF